MKKQFDFLLVGQGIAGTVLAETLLNRGVSVMVADQYRPDSSSQVAAGIFNPITGRKMTKTWLADLLFPFLRKFYSELEEKLGAKFFYPTNLYYPFDSQEKQNDWLVQMNEPKYQGYISGFHEDGLYPEQVLNSFGGMEITQSGYVDLKTMLSAYRAFLQQQELLIEDTILWEDLIFSEGKVTWRERTFGKVIYCNGEKAREIPAFEWLDFRPVKGEILTVEIEGAPLHHIINRNGWTLPWHDGTYKVGATYDNHHLNTQPTEKGKSYLLERFEGNIKSPYKVTAHQAGIRPATYDRRPFIGLHPEIPELGIFNGMGAKGVSQTPFFAQQFADFLRQGSPLFPEVNLERLRNRKKK